MSLVDPSCQLAPTCDRALSLVALGNFYLNLCCNVVVMFNNCLVYHQMVMCALQYFCAVSTNCQVVFFQRFLECKIFKMCSATPKLCITKDKLPGTLDAITCHFKPWFMHPLLNKIIFTLKLFFLLGFYLLPTGNFLINQM